MDGAVSVGCRSMATFPSPDRIRKGSHAPEIVVVHVSITRWIKRRLCIRKLGSTRSVRHCQKLGTQCREMVMMADGAYRSTDGQIAR
jgi:hypothetical protein